jgi:tetratricopeptide (TPR) repeat protein
MTVKEAEELLELAREAQFSGPTAREWVERLGPRRDALVEAATTLASDGNGERAVELASRTFRVFLMLDDIAKGRAMLAAALDTAEPVSSSARALALYGDGMLAFRAGDNAASLARSQDALATAQEVGDRRGEALALVGLSRVALREGNYGRVQALAAEALALARSMDASAQAAPLHLLAAGTRLAGDYDDAAKLYQESLELSRSLADQRSIGMELHNLAHVQLHRGNLADAERLFTECDALRNHDDPYEVAMSQLNRAALAWARGEQASARDLLGQARSTLAGANIVLDPDDAFEVIWLATQLET